MDNSIRICKPRYHQCPTILGTGKFDGKFDAKRWREENRRNGAVQRQSSYRRWGRGVIWCARFLFLSVRVINDYHNNRHYTVYRGLPNEVSGRLSGKRKGREGEERERERERQINIYTRVKKNIGSTASTAISLWKFAKPSAKISLFERERERGRFLKMRDTRGRGEDLFGWTRRQFAICLIIDRFVKTMMNTDRDPYRISCDYRYIKI